MPFRPSEHVSPRDRLAFEIRLCVAAAGGCLLVGGIGLLINWLADIDTHLPALIAVGGFYGLMGLARWWKLSRWTDTDSTDDSPQPGH